MVRRGVANIVNTKTGKKYTVRSYTDLDKRLEDYTIKLAYGNHSNKSLQRDYDKYGGNNFKIEILKDDCTSEKEVNRLGNQEIRKNQHNNKSYNKRKGNVTFEGGNPDAVFPSESGTEVEMELVHNYQKPTYSTPYRSPPRRPARYGPPYKEVIAEVESKRVMREEKLFNYARTKTTDSEMLKEIKSNIHCNHFLTESEVDKLIERLEEIKNPSIYCVKCKTKVDKDDKFCNNCGHNLNKTDVDEIEENKNSKSKWFYFIILIIVFVIFVKILRII